MADRYFLTYAEAASYAKLHSREAGSHIALTRHGDGWVVGSKAQPVPQLPNKKGTSAKEGADQKAKVRLRFEEEKRQKVQDRKQGKTPQVVNNTLPKPELQEIRDRARRKLIKQRQQDALLAKRDANWRREETQKEEHERFKKETECFRIDELQANQSNGSISRSELLELWSYRDKLTEQIRDLVRKALIAAPAIPYFIAPPPMKEKVRRFYTCPVCGGDGGAAGQCYKCEGTGWI